MPELPEVETIRRALEPAMTGHRIARAQVRRPDLRVPFPPDLEAKLKGRRIDHVGRRAKYLMIRIDDGNILVIHLGMSGRVLIAGPEEKHALQKHDHFILDLDNGAKIILNDARRFGMVLYIPEKTANNHPAFRAMGPEPLDNNFSAPVLAKALAGKKTTIKAALLDQRNVAGLGNIYVCEALFFAGIDPRRIAGTLNEKEIEALATAIRNVLNAALKAGGSSLKDYRQADGTLGYFQHNFSVYDREGQPCPGCVCDVTKTGGVQRIVQSGRSTFFCAEKQK